MNRVNPIPGKVGNLMDNFQGGPGIFPAPKTFNLIPPPPLGSYPPSLPSFTGATPGSPLAKSGDKVNNATDEALDGLDDAATGEYDESSEYMKKLEKDIEAKKLQQQKEEKAFLDKGVKEQETNAKTDEEKKTAKALTDKYNKYKEDQEENKQEETKLKEELRTKNEALKAAKTDEERAKKLSGIKETQTKQEELKEKQARETQTMHYEYDQHLSKKPQTQPIIQERESLKYINDRWQHVESLDRNFNKTKQDYFINPSTGDWRSFDEFKALPADKQKEIKDGYRNDLYNKIKPSLESLKGSFGSGQSNINLGPNPFQKNQPNRNDIFAGKLSGLQTRDSQINGPTRSFAQANLGLDIANS